jgi:hypothetical protein
VLFFANWCDICHTELPALAKVIAGQEHSHGPLSSIQILGVDSLDLAGPAMTFLNSAGVTFPVGFDSNGYVLSSQYRFVGPPYAVFISGNGKITAIHASSMTPGALVSTEKRMLRVS